MKLVNEQGYSPSEPAKSLGIDSGYFTNAGITKPLLHTWSLAVEEQFYLLYPLLLVLLRRLGRRSMFFMLSVLALLSLLVGIKWTSKQSSAAFYLLPSRAWELL